ncbi:putative rhamnogalacturonate lyase C [Psilocybe cubensis]|uniref:Rhamnogalacturonate lyase C n=2 Tax=Psilocybe cubensis TaxID=181762 RepID=A0ACB8GL56_PSICU|nr:putative rhamnogalacturonate lyase C [Psilocybe cubensis]KAH9476112.1 putative rhamnogalacturonate lyase C [Psilocybe cubensis]
MDALFDRRPPTNLEDFRRNPVVFLAKRGYYAGVTHCEPPTTPRIQVVAISDTHNHHGEVALVPDGDILIHAGDLTQSGTRTEMISALQWLADQPHPHKIFIAGNHDLGLNVPKKDLHDLLEDFPGLVYLAESSVTLTINTRTVRIYGSPMTPKFGSWPFQYPRTKPEDAHWDKIPLDTDILITHGPPAHHADHGNGCGALLKQLWSVRPRLHVFGHIHTARGIEHVAWSDAQAAYERIMTNQYSWREFLALLWGIWRVDKAKSTLINAASLGGFRDEERRDAIVIDI